MAEKTAQHQVAGPAQQQQVLSIRVSEELRLRLEMLRQLISLKTGETITTSDAARQLLESARGNRLELANLLTKPAQSLVNARHKADRAELNLYQLLDELEFPNLAKLNQALWPYWTILWRVAARGHYFRHGKPLSFPRLTDQRVPPPPLPGFQEGECALSLTRLPFDTFSLFLHLPGRLAPLFPINEYPAIAELRTLLEEFDPNLEDSLWRGYYFSAYTTKAETGDLMVCFRSEATGITFTLSQSDWSAIRNMTRRAWEKSEVRRLWDQWAHDYGEM